MPEKLVASLFIYPNACRTQATVEFANPDGEQLMVTIFDIAGNKVIQKSTTFNVCQFNGLAIPDGVYIDFLILNSLFSNIPSWLLILAFLKSIVV